MQKLFAEKSLSVSKQGQGQDQDNRLSLPFFPLLRKLSLSLDDRWATLFFSGIMNNTFLILTAHLQQKEQTIHLIQSNYQEIKSLFSASQENVVINKLSRNRLIVAAPSPVCFFLKKTVLYVFCRAAQRDILFGVFRRHFKV